MTYWEYRIGFRDGLGLGISICLVAYVIMVIFT
jgi:hypothetical protein